MRMVACPVALHPDGMPRQIAPFEHPNADLQLAKGGINPGETIAAAAARKLYEESGLDTRAALPPGNARDIYPDQKRHFALCRIASPVRARWQHHCADDGGHLFKFQWMPLDASRLAGFESRFLRAFDWIRNTL